MKHRYSYFASRRRFTATEIQDLLLELHQSGLTQREFAHRHQIGLSTLQRWVRLSKGQSKPVKWVEVNPPPSRPTITNAPGYEIGLAPDLHLYVPRGFDPDELKSLVGLLRQSL